MVCDIQGRRSTARAATASVLAAALALDGAPAFAQRRRAEPEANPNFSEQMKTKSDGGPVGRLPPPPSLPSRRVRPATTNSSSRAPPRA